MTVTSGDDPSSWQYHTLQALGLNSHPFLSTPSYSSTFSKCVRKGAGLDLSGSESYNGLVLPILKSVLHFQHSERPPTTAVYFDAHIVVGVGVLDAPMIGVTVDDTSTTLTLIPWVRVTRHESLEGPHTSERTKLRAVDIVHKDFLFDYLDQNVMPFAKDFATLALKHQVVIANCEAFVPGMGRDSWNDIETRLKPKTLAASLSRAGSVGRNALNQLRRKKGET
jgi:hypothetical protein